MAWLNNKLHKSLNLLMTIWSVRNIQELNKIKIRYTVTKTVSWDITLSLLESVMETFKVVLNFGSVDEFLWCDHSNESSSAVLSHGTIYI